MTESLTTHELELLRKWRLTHPQCPECTAPSKQLRGTRDGYRRLECDNGHMWSLGLKGNRKRHGCPHGDADVYIHPKGNYSYCRICVKEKNAVKPKAEAKTNIATPRTIRGYTF